MAREGITQKIETSVNRLHLSKFDFKFLERKRAGRESFKVEFRIKFGEFVEERGGDVKLEGKEFGRTEEEVRKFFGHEVVLEVDGGVEEDEFNVSCTF